MDDMNAPLWGQTASAQRADDNQVRPVGLYVPEALNSSA